MFQIGICDDNKEDIELVKQELQKISNELECEFQIVELKNDASMVEYIIKNNIHIVLLDIDMPGMTGLDIANALTKEKPLTNIIFLTNREELVFQTLKYHPLRFIRKNFMQTELKEAIEAAIRKIATETYVIHVSKGNTALSVAIEDILYVESNKHYVELHLLNEVHRVRGKISDWEIKLSELGFIRIQVGYLVNIRYIMKLTSKEVTLDNGEKLAISRNYIEKVQKQYMDGLERFVNGKFI